MKGVYKPEATQSSYAPVLYRPMREVYMILPGKPSRNKSIIFCSPFLGGPETLPWHRRFQLVAQVTRHGVLIMINTYSSKSCLKFFLSILVLSGEV